MTDRDKSQLDRFKDAARQLKTNDNEKVFDKKLGKLVKQKPDVREKSESEKVAAIVACTAVVCTLIAILLQSILALFGCVRRRKSVSFFNLHSI